MKRRILSIITALALCWSLCPTWAFAYEGEPDTGLCVHHPYHTDECGYIAPSEGQPCGHEHTDECNVEETLCVHVHDETCYSDGELPAEGEDKAADTCAHVCTVDSGCVTLTLDCQHTHDSECGYVQADPGQPCGYECKLCPIEDMIAALPRWVTEANRAEVETQLQEILDLWRELSEDEQDQIGMTLCWDLLAALDEANAPAPVAGEVSTAYQEASWNGSAVTYSNQTAASCTPVADSAEAVTWNTGWYVVNSSVTIEKPITVSGDVNLILADGCELNAEQGILVTENNSLTIYAQTGGTGTLNATGVYDNGASAGIGGGTTSSTANSGTITIHGGMINATGGGQSGNVANAAGIGGGSLFSGNGGSSGTIVIYGGTVTANSGTGLYTGAGIGGGSGGSFAGGEGSNITIYGGNVTATSSGAVVSGAGVGGGAGSSNGGAGNNIKIYGGEVTATSSGSTSGAGIGGGAGNRGNGGAGSNIEISGGSVNATGGNSGAGIGGGGTAVSGKASGDGSDIAIKGGEVTAIGGQFAAGIGGGGGFGNNITSGTGTDISITGGIVDAQGGRPNNNGNYAGDPIGNGGNASGDAGVTRTTGIIFENGAGKVYGTVALDGEYTVKDGYTLTFAEGGKFDGNYAFYQNGSPIEMATVKENGVIGPATVRECTHPGDLQDNGDGTHGGDCPYCGAEFAAVSHTLGAGNKCEGCGAELKVQVESGGKTTYYGDLGPAWTAVEKVTSAEITLLDDVTATLMPVSSEMSEMNVTINGGSHTLSITGFMVGNGGQLDITGGTFEMAFLSVSGGTVHLSGGTFRIGSGGGISCSFGVASLLLNYGSTNVSDKHYAYFDETGKPIALTEGQTTLTVTVKVQECEHDASVCEYQPLDGGTSHKKTCLACGMTWEAQPHTNTDHNNQCDDCETQLVASVQIGSATTYYGTIESAWAAAQGETATLSLLSNVTATTKLEMTGGNITFIGGNYTLTSTSIEYAVSVRSGTLTVESGTIYTNANVAAGVKTFGGTLEVTGGKIEADYYGIMAQEGSVRISGGEVISGYYGLSRSTTNADVKISGGTISGVELNSGKVCELLLNYGTTTEPHYAFYQDGHPVDLPQDTTLSGTYTVRVCNNPYTYSHTPGTTKHTQSCQYCGAGNSETDCNFTWTDNTGVCDCGAELVVDVSADELTYDGTAKEPEVTVTLDGTDLDSDKYTVAYKDNTAAGDASVTVTIGGVTYTETFSIGKAPLTVTGATATSRDYDGTASVAVTAVALDGAVSNDNVSVAAGSLTGTISSANAGEYTTVTLPALTLSGEKAGNYTLTQPNGAVPATVMISPLTITVTPDEGQKKEYGAADPTLTYKIAPSLIGNDKLTGALAYEGADVDKYPITLGTLTAGDNYKLELTSGVMFEITKPSLETAAVSLSSGPYTYNGTAHTPTVTVVKGDRTLTKDILKDIFARAKAIDERDFIKQQVQNTAKEYQQKLTKAKAEYAKYSRELAKWEGLMLDSIEGTCVFSPEQIKKRMDTVQESVTSLTEEIETLQNKVDESKAVADEILEQHHRLLSWADMFIDAPSEEKKMIAAYLIKAVTLTRDYGIQIEFNISEAQYLSGMEMG